MELTRRALMGSTLALAASPAAHAAQSVLRIAIGTSLATLDPMKATIGDEYIYDCLVFNGLTRMREDLTIEPDLAESWDYTPDLKQWTFHLRHGVKFHNGREMVADDVVAFYKRMLDPANAAPSRSNYEMVDSVAASDPYTVVFLLKFPYGGFADILSDRQVKIVPRDLVDQLTTKPIGTGPFMFVSYTPGDRLVLARNPHYYEAGLPKVDGVELRIIPEMSVRIAALQAGDLDIVWDLPLEQVAQLKGKSDLRVDSVATASWDAAIMNNTTAPFNDVRVRRAFQLGIDRRDVVELTLFGQGAPTISPIPPTHPFYARDIPVSAADPAAARKLLAEAGHPSGIQVPIIVPVGRPVRERLGVTLQQLAQPAGFDLTVQRVPFASYDAEVSGKAPLYIDGYFARPTIDTSTYPFLHTKASWNEKLWHYSDTEVDKALEAARLTGDVAQQKTQYIAMQHALNDDPCGFFAYAVNFACAYRSAVQNVQTHPMRWFDLRHATIT
ncbi:MAG: ABC transporter substrate-binding protein [Acidisphaera sp.]|nr:ABC transporter substrate-binding protein [Acidisphaera sp.]